jgi:TonB-dependent Receptor Plug Domain
MKAHRIPTSIGSATSKLSSAFLILALLSPAMMQAQDAATLARYDKNHNGKLDPDEIAAMQADQAKVAQTPVTSGASKDVVTLNPFQVDAGKDVGYYAENTLAGTRLNTNVGDLASSITVVTKQQLEDTGALNINDVFLYEANTEGAGNYTPTYVNRGTATDLIGGYSGDDGTPFGIATANRIRGLGTADTSQNNFPTIARLAFDSYNTNSVEINRGPNSMLFGSGGASGVVNNSTSEAALNQTKSEVSVRFGSFGAHRESASVNVPVGSKVALFFAALYDDKEFERKPSYDVYRRQYAAITYKPFSKTKITGSFEAYDNANNRPNFIDPSDYVSNWLNNGKPSWNPVTQTITLGNGTVSGPYLNSTLDPRWSPGVSSGGTGNITGSTNAFYVPGIAFNGHNIIFVNPNGTVSSAWVSSGTTGAATNGSTAVPAATARTAAQWIAQNEVMSQSAAPFAPVPPASTGATSYSTWYDKGFTNKALYDWTKYNAQGANYGTQNARSYSVDLQQQILPNLNLDVGWFRQEMGEWDHYGLGQSNQATRILVDTNTMLLNGTPNPHYLSPYIFDYQSDTFASPETNNNLRALLAYNLDFTKHEGWLGYLGKHQFSALVSQQKDWRNNLRFRLAFDGGDPRFLPNQNPPIANNFNWAGSASIQRDYYLSTGNSGGAVTTGIHPLGESNFGGPGKVALNYYDWNSGAGWQSTQMSMDPNLFYAGSNYGVNYKILDATSFAYQGNLWNNRLIPTLGTRYDKARIYTYNGTAPGGAGIPTQTLYTNGFGNLQYASVIGTAPYDVGGDTTTEGIVARPFSGWKPIDGAAERGNIFADFVRGLGFSYNHSDNFTAPSTPTTDFFGNILAKPSGTGKDYGVRGSIINNKLSWSLDWYKANNVNAVSSAASTAIGRAERIDNSSTFVWAREVVRIRNGQDPTDINFDNNTVFPLTPAMQTQINALVAGPEVKSDGTPVVLAQQVNGQGSLPWPNTNIQGTNSQESKGMEGSLIYNPTRNWNIKLTFGKQVSTYNKAIGEITAWLYGTGTAANGNGRLNFWQNVAAPDLPTVYTRNNGNKLYLGSFWNSYGYGGDANSNTTGATSTPNSTYYGIVDSQLYQLITLQGTRSPSEREYNSSLISNYSFQEGRLKGFSVGGSVRWASNATVGYYGSLDPAKYTHPTATQNLISYPDLTRPIYDPATMNLDAWVSYTTRVPVFGKSVRAKFQLNCVGVNENGGLRPIVFEADGSPAQYRIVDPRTFFLTSTFDF